MWSMGDGIQRRCGVNTYTQTAVMWERVQDQPNNDDIEKAERNRRGSAKGTS